MKPKDKPVETVDEKTRLIRQYEQLLQLFSRKRKEADEVQQRIQEARLRNKHTASELKSLHYQLADSFTSLPEEAQQSSPPITQPTQSQLVRVDEQRLQEIVAEEKVRMQLDLSRLQASYLEEQLTQLKDKSTAMNLAVCIKTNLQRLRQRHSLLTRKAEGLRKRCEEESYVESDYQRMFR